MVISTQLRTQCTHILSISLALGCRMISGAVRMVSVWNSGTLPRTRALKDCRFLREVDTEGVAAQVQPRVWSWSAEQQGLGVALGRSLSQTLHAS